MISFDPASLTLEEAVLAAMAYSDLFAHPLTAKEVWFWLPQKATPKEVSKALAKLASKGIVHYSSPFYFLGDRTVINWRREKEQVSQEKLPKAESFGQKLIRLPWMGAVFVSGNLALGVADKNDDLDFFVIASPGCLYRARLASVLLAEILGQRRRPEDKEAEDKVCLNLFLEANNLVLPKSRHDFYTAHEALQLLLVAGNYCFYQRFLFSNSWLADYLPQAYRLRLGSISQKPPSLTSPKIKPSFLEKAARLGQLSYAKHYQRQLVVNDDRQLFFHPQDQRQIILGRFQKNWQKLLGLLTDPGSVIKPLDKTGLDD